MRELNNEPVLGMIVPGMGKQDSRTRGDALPGLPDTNARIHAGLN